MSSNYPYGIRSAGQCPYCEDSRRGLIGIDVDALHRLRPASGFKTFKLDLGARKGRDVVLFSPDLASGVPCPHLLNLDVDVRYDLNGQPLQWVSGVDVDFRADVGPGFGPRQEYLVRFFTYVYGECFGNEFISATPFKYDGGGNVGNLRADFLAPNEPKMGYAFGYTFHWALDTPAFLEEVANSSDYKRWLKRNRRKIA